MAKTRKPAKSKAPKGAAKKRRRSKRKSSEPIVVDNTRRLVGRSDAEDFKQDIDYDKHYQKAGVRPGALFRSYHGDVSELQKQLKIYDQARLKRLRADARRRPQIFKRIDKFKELLAEHYGKRKLKVIVRFSITLNSLLITTVFTPSKTEHPMAADELIHGSLKESGLGKYMHFLGSATSIPDGVRSIDFEEIR